MFVHQQLLFNSHHSRPFINFSWANFEQTDHNTGKMTPMGSVAYRFVHYDVFIYLFI